MAFWNAPLDCKDHAELAVKSALEVLDATKKLNQEFLLSTCLLLMSALASAQENVLSETWGQKLDLTIQSSEMQSTWVLDSKDKQEIMMGWTCCYRKELIDYVHQFKEVDRILVKGKSEKVRIYTPLGTD